MTWKLWFTEIQIWAMDSVRYIGGRRDTGVGGRIEGGRKEGESMSFY